MQASEKSFYGWKIVGACFCFMCVTMGLVFNCNGLFIKPIIEELGYTRPQLSVITTLYAVGQMIVALLSGKIFARFKVRQVMLVSAVVISIATAGLGFAHSLPMFYLCAIFVGLAMGGTCVVPISLLVGKWFHYRMGTAIGISMTGSGAGGMLFSSIIGFVLPRIGWRMTYLCSGAVMAAVAIPLAIFVIRETPEEMGLTPLENPEEFYSEIKHKEPEGVTLKEARKMPIFWVFVLCGLFCVISFTSMNQHISPYLTDLGYSYSFSAMIASLGMGSLAVGKTALGVIYDRTSPRFGTVFSGCCGIIALAGCVLASFPLALVPYVLCTGMGCAFGTVAFPLLTEALFGQKDYAAIYGVMTFTTSLAASLSPMVTAAFYDVTGSYRWAFLCFFLWNSVATLIYYKLLPAGKHR